MKLLWWIRIILLFNQMRTLTGFATLFIGDGFFVVLQVQARKCAVFAIKGAVQRRFDRVVELLGNEKKNSDAMFRARRPELI